MPDLPPTRLLTPEALLADEEGELLYLYDQAISAGELDDFSRISWVRLGASDQWASALECLELMSRIWPRPRERRPVEDIAGKRMGRFLLQKELGRGGTSIVFLAIDPLLKRPVALKVPRPATLATPDLRRRFLQEGRAAAALKHRNIVAVLEAAENEAACYLVSEYCRGPSLAEWLKERTRLIPARVAANWMADLADAAHHAHQQGVLHRDIKPSNVLLEPANPGEPAGEFEFAVKLSDFGLAKLLSDQGETRSGAILGTPAYMSPEQAAGQVKRITEISDVYSLGAVLYELLTGRPPFQAESDLDLLQQVVHDEPVAPRKLHGAVPRDLETICLKCLAKEPVRRYASAGELADDLRRFLSDRPIRAKPVTMLGRGARWIRRNPGLTAIGFAAAVLTVMAGVGLAWHFQQIAELDRTLAASEKRREEQKVAAALAEELARRQENAAGLRTVQSFVEQHQYSKAVLLLETLRNRSSDPPGFAWRYWWNVCHERELFPLVGTRGPVRGIAISPDDTLVAGCTGHGQIAIWDAGSALPLQEWNAFSEPGYRVVFSPGGKYLGAISQTGSVGVWDTRSRQAVRWWTAPVKLEREIQPDLCFTEDERRVAIATESHTVVLVDIATGEIEESPAQPEPIKQVRFLPGSQRMVTAGYDGVRIWSADGTRWDVHLPERPVVTALAVSHDGTLLAYGRSIKNEIDVANEVIIHDVRTGKTVVQLPHATLARNLAFSGDGRRLLAVTSDRSVVWDLHDRVRIRMNSTAMNAGALARHGRLAALTGVYGQVWLLRLDKPPRNPPEPQHAVEAWTVAYHPDGKLIATGSDDNTLVLWERETGRKAWTFEGHEGTISQAVFTPAGDELVAASLDNTLSVVSLTGQRRVRLEGHAKPVRCVAVSRDGRWIVSGDHAGVVRVWSLRTGKPERELSAHPSRKVRTIVFSQNGQSCLTGGEDNCVCRWDTESWQLKQKWKDLDQVWALAIHPRERTVAQGNALGMITIRDLDSGQVQRTLQGHTDGIRSLAYCPAGRTLASGSEDQQVRLWDVETSQEVTVLKRHHQDLHDIAFAPDGRQLASTSHDGQVHVWHASSLENVFLPHPREAGPAAVSDQGDLRFPWVQSIRTVMGGKDDDGVDFQVTFSEEVTGVDAADFRVSRNGVLDAGADVSVLRETGTVYAVHVGRLGDTRRLRLDLVDDRSIRDLAGNALTAREARPTFAAAGTLATGPDPADITAADLNGDGLADLLVASSEGHYVSLWMGHEDRLFPTESALGTIRSPLRVAAGDLNGDNFADVVTVNGDSTVGVFLGIPGPVTGLSEGSFLEPQLFPVGPLPEGLVLGDFNRDSRLDALVATPGAASASLLLGLGNGDFAPEQRIPLPAGPRAIAAGDLDNDGHQDFAALLTDGGAATCLGNGNGAFRPAVSCEIGTSPRTLAITEFTGDGIVDLVTASGDSQRCLVHVGNEKGTFGKPWAAACGPDPQDLIVADLNSDGFADAVVLDAVEGTVSLFFSGGRKLHRRETLAVGERPTAIAAGDFNEDHRTDLAVLCAGSRTVTLWLNDFRGDFEGQVYRANTR